MDIHDVVRLKDNRDALAKARAGVRMTLHLQPTVARPDMVARCHFRKEKNFVHLAFKVIKAPVDRRCFPSPDGMRP